MKAAIKIYFTFDQVLSLVKQLPTKEKIMLTKELEKDGIKSKLARLLADFQTNNLSQETIDNEVESVRLKIYESSLAF